MRKYKVNVWNRNNNFRLLMCSAALYIKFQRKKQLLFKDI